MFLPSLEYAGMAPSWTSDQARGDDSRSGVDRCDSLIQQACGGVGFWLPAHTVELFSSGTTASFQEVAVLRVSQS